MTCISRRFAASGLGWLLLFDRGARLETCFVQAFALCVYRLYSEAGLTTKCTLSGIGNDHCYRHIVRTLPNLLVKLFRS